MFSISWFPLVYLCCMLTMVVFLLWKFWSESKYIEFYHKRFVICYLISSGLPDVPYKTRLQSFTQKCNISLPMYINVNEGRQHDPKFRSTVWVDGMKYTSPNTFSRLRAAEADVARMALENLHVKFKTEERPVTHEVCCNLIFMSNLRTVN